METLDLLLGTNRATNRIEGIQGKYEKWDPQYNGGLVAAYKHEAKKQSGLESTIQQNAPLRELDWDVNDMKLISFEQSSALGGPLHWEPRANYSCCHPLSAALGASTRNLSSRPCHPFSAIHDPNCTHH